jgi:hypothetical protein
VTHLTQQCVELAESLSPPEGTPGNRIFSTAHMPSCKHHRIGKDASGNIVVLVALDPARNAGALPPVFLEHLAVLHSVRCTVSEGQGSADSGLFTVVRCTSSDQGLRRHFITLVTSLVMTLPAVPSCDEAAATITRMIQLFRALAKPSTRSVQGLWGELFIISAAAEPSVLAAAWHVDPYEQFDFSAGASRLEVKSTKRGKRSHIFSLSQVRPPPGVQAVIASLRVEPSSGGTSLGELWHGVRGRLQNDAGLLVHVDRVVAISLGRAWRRGLEARFDSQTAINSLNFFLSSSVPSVSDLLPSEVSDVKFRADISAALPTTADELRNLGLFFAAAVSANDVTLSD